MKNFLAPLAYTPIITVYIIMYYSILLNFFIASYIVSSLLSLHTNNSAVILLCS